MRGKTIPFRASQMKSRQKTLKIAANGKFEFNFFLRDSPVLDIIEFSRRKWNNYANDQQNKTHFINNQIGSSHS